MNQTPDAREQKSILRRAMRTRRDNLGAVFRDAASAEIRRRILELPQLKGRAAVAVYLATKNEANVDAVVDALWSRGCEVVAPVVQPDYAFASLRNGIQINAKGWREPKQGEGEGAFDARLIDMILLPGLAFDWSGVRLGQGGGWYDRVLNNLPRALAIGICFDCQLLEALPREAHDQRVQIIVTEKRILQIEK